MDVRFLRASASFCSEMVSIPVCISCAGSRDRIIAPGALHWGGIPSVRAIIGETNASSVVKLTTTHSKRVCCGNYGTSACSALSMASSTWTLVKGGGVFMGWVGSWWFFWSNVGDKGLSVEPCWGEGEQVCCSML
ncbi:hypothetical protein FCV25MIE_01541 [Fagus crenata]